jgi:hypothetical protein
MGDQSWNSDGRQLAELAGALVIRGHESRDSEFSVLERVGHLIRRCEGDEPRHIELGDEFESVVNRGSITHVERHDVEQKPGLPRSNACTLNDSARTDLIYLMRQRSDAMRSSALQ